MYIVVGLGNPGNKYSYTKHNAGFLAIDRLAEKLNIKVNKIKYKAIIGEGNYKSEKIILVKPQTYMNLSGESVREIFTFYKINIHNLFVIYDDIDLEIGKLRIRKKGSAGTHNGMKNIIYQLSNDDFPRFRIGISSPKENIDLASYVLSNFTKEELKILDKTIDNCAESIMCAIEYDLDTAMNKFNKR